MTSTATIKGNFVPSDLSRLDPSFINGVILATRLKDCGTINGKEGTYKFLKSKIGWFETIIFGDEQGSGVGMIMTDMRTYKHRIMEDRDSDFYEAMIDIVKGGENSGDS